MTNLKFRAFSEEAGSKAPQANASAARTALHNSQDVDDNLYRMQYNCP